MLLHNLKLYAFCALESLRHSVTAEYEFFDLANFEMTSARQNFMITNGKGPQSPSPQSSIISSISSMACSLAWHLIGWCGINPLFEQCLFVLAVIDF